jgi:Rrf2 family protein
MDVSARAMYGLRALVTLAEARSSDPMSIQQISDEENLPYKFLEGIMADLKRGGFVESKRGASGGYFLSNPPSEITLLEVLEYLDGPISPVDLGEPKGEECITDREKAFIPVWREIKESMERVLENYTIQSIVDGLPHSLNEDLNPIYQI